MNDVLLTVLLPEEGAVVEGSPSFQFNHSVDHCFQQPPTAAISVVWHAMSVLWKDQLLGGQG